MLSIDGNGRAASAGPDEIVHHPAPFMRDEIDLPWLRAKTITVDRDMDIVAQGDAAEFPSGMGRWARGGTGSA